MDHFSPQVLEGITAAQEALELLLPAGDFTGALDVLWGLKMAGTPAHVAGVHAFQMLPKQLAAYEEVSNPEQLLLCCLAISASWTGALNNTQVTITDRTFFTYCRK